MIDFGIPYTLLSPQGTLELNVPTTAHFGGSNSNYVFLLDPPGCKATIGPLRRDTDPVPSADGSLPHAGFLNGMTIALAMQFWLDFGGDSAREPACGEDLRVMWDTLLLHLRALVNPTIQQLYGGQCRWTYQPPPGTIDMRLVDHLRLAEWVDPAYASPLTSTTFKLDSDLPYELDATESANDEVDIIPSAFTNAGNTEVFPAFRVHASGSTDIVAFEISNNTTGQQILYDSSQPGTQVIPAGHYAEILCFRNTIYLDGSSANLKPGLDVESSDFFSLVPGDNILEYICPSGGRCEILWNNAWAG